MDRQPPKSTRNDTRLPYTTPFRAHGHRDMEIIIYVIQGALGHKDSMGNGASIVPGEVQRMSAGRGVTHSEFNYDREGVTHFLQIWIIPATTGLTPGDRKSTRLNSSH